MAVEIYVDVSAEVQAEVKSAREAVETLFHEVVAWIVGAKTERLWDVEGELRTRLQAFACALLRLWFASRRPTSARRVVQGPDNRRYRHHGSRLSAVKAVFGEVRFRRDFYVIGGGKRGDTFAPLDRELGLQTTGFSVRTICMASFLCAKMAFADARGTLDRFWGWAPSTKSLLVMTDQVGPLARPFLESLPAPVDDGEVLVLLVDSKGAPMITDTELSRRRRPHKKRPRGEARPWRRRPRIKGRRKRRKKGDKSKNAKMANVGVIYTLRVKDGVVEGPIAKRVYATFRPMSELMKWMRREADKRGYGQKRTVFLADGDRKIWALQKTHFPLAEPCLDWFHVSEKVWSIGETLYPEGSEQLATWVSDQLGDLRAGRIQALLRRLHTLEAGLPRSGPGTRGRRKRMCAGIRYLETNKARMPYDKLRRDGLDIGSGAVEGAVRQLGMRLDGPGMRWSPARAEHVIQLRCIVINGDWRDFEDYIAQHAHAGGLRARSPEGLGSTHNAKRKKAA